MRRPLLRRSVVAHGWRAVAVAHRVPMVPMGVGLGRVLAGVDIGIRHREARRAGEREPGDCKPGEHEAAEAIPPPSGRRQQTVAPLHPRRSHRTRAPGRSSA